MFPTTIISTPQGRFRVVQATASDEGDMAPEQMSLWRHELSDRASATCPHANCRLSFLSLVGITSHYKQCTGVTSHFTTCDICGARFKSYKSILSHKTKVHFKSPMVQPLPRVPKVESDLVMPEYHGIPVPSHSRAANEPPNPCDVDVRPIFDIELDDSQDNESPEEKAARIMAESRMISNPRPRGRPAKSPYRIVIDKSTLQYRDPFDMGYPSEYTSVHSHNNIHHSDHFVQGQILTTPQGSFVIQDNPPMRTTSGPAEVDRIPSRPLSSSSSASSPLQRVESPKARSVPPNAHIAVSSPFQARRSSNISLTSRSDKARSCSTPRSTTESDLEARERELAEEEAKLEEFERMVEESEQEAEEVARKARISTWEKRLQEKREALQRRHEMAMKIKMETSMREERLQSNRVAPKQIDTPSCMVKDSQVVSNPTQFNAVETQQYEQKQQEDRQEQQEEQEELQEGQQEQEEEQYLDSESVAFSSSAMPQPLDSDELVLDPEAIHDSAVMILESTGIVPNFMEEQEKLESNSSLPTNSNYIIDSLSVPPECYDEIEEEIAPPIEEGAQIIDQSPPPVIENNLVSSPKKTIVSASLPIKSLGEAPERMLSEIVNGPKVPEVTTEKQNIVIEKKEKQKNPPRQVSTRRSSKLVKEAPAIPTPQPTTTKRKRKSRNEVEIAKQVSIVHETSVDEEKLENVAVGKKVEKEDSCKKSLQQETKPRRGRSSRGSIESLGGKSEKLPKRRREENNAEEQNQTKVDRNETHLDIKPVNSVLSASNSVTESLEGKLPKKRGRKLKGSDPKSSVTPLKAVEEAPFTGDEISSLVENDAEEQIQTKVDRNETHSDIKPVNSVLSASNSVNESVEVKLPKKRGRKLKGSNPKPSLIPSKTVEEANIPGDEITSLVENYAEEQIPTQVDRNETHLDIDPVDSVLSASNSVNESLEGKLPKKRGRKVKGSDPKPSLTPSKALEETPLFGDEIAPLVEEPPKKVPKKRGRKPRGYTQPQEPKVEDEVEDHKVESDLAEEPPLKVHKKRGRKPKGYVPEHPVISKVEEKVEEEEEEEEVPENGGRQRRKAAKKASKRVSEAISMLKKDEDGKEKDNEEALLDDEVSDDEAYNEMDVNKYFKLSGYGKAKKITCTVCQEVFKSVKSVESHIISEHAEQLHDDEEEEDLEDDDNFSDKASSNGNESDVELDDVIGGDDRELSSKKMSRKSSPAGSRPKNSRPLEPSADLVEVEKEFRLNNYFKNKFEEFRSKKSDWENMSEQGLKLFAPKALASCQFKTSFKGSSTDPSRLERFSVHTDSQGHVEMFTGGPIWASAWCPKSLHGTHYLALSSHQEFDKCTKLSDGEVEMGLIQIYEFSLDSNGSVSGSLSLSIGHNFGRIWELDWCPSILDDLEEEEEETKMLGLLAIAGSDGTIRIFSIPEPNSLGGDKPVFALSKPRRTLRVSSEKRDLKVTCLSWYKGCQHRVIAGGFSDGSVALWNVTEREGGLNRMSGKNEIFPYLNFKAHLADVTTLDLKAEDGSEFPEVLASAGCDRLLHVWNLKQSNSPVYTMKKGLARTITWLPHTVNKLIVSFDDGYLQSSTRTVFLDLDAPDKPKVFPIVPQNSAVFTHSYNQWLHTVVLGTSAGEVIMKVMAPLTKSLEHDKSAKNRRVFVTKVTVDEKVKSEDKTEEELQFKNEPSYEDLERGHVLNFENFRFKSSQQVANDQTLPMLPEFFAVEDITSFPLSAINTVCHNCNPEALGLVFCGGQSGIGRVVNISYFNEFSENVSLS